MCFIRAIILKVASPCIDCSQARFNHRMDW